MGSPLTCLVETVGVFRRNAPIAPQAACPRRQKQSTGLFSSANSSICSLLVRLPITQKQQRPTLKVSLYYLVEAGGVEPPSKNLFLSASPSADYCLSFPYITDKNQTVILGSSYFMTVAGTSHCSHLPLNDALPKPRYSLVGRPPN